MNKQEIVKKLKEVKIKMKTTNKKNDYEEYLKLKDERLKLEAELAKMKKEYYAQAEAAAKIKLRKGQDHKKFIYGGLIVKYFGIDIEPEKLEEKLKTITVNHSEDVKNNNDDITEYLKNIQG
ncbi:MAG: hypothetical protein ACYCSW_03840 [bacterium]